MQLNTAVAILTIQAIENPDEKEKCFQMIDILSKNSTEKYSTVDDIVKLMCADLYNRQTHLSKKPDAYSYCDQFNLKHIIEKTSDLEFLQNFGIYKFLSQDKKARLSIEIKNCIENSYITINHTIPNIQQSIKQFIIPKLTEYCNRLEETKATQPPIKNLNMDEPTKINTCSMLTSVQEFLTAYNQTPDSIQTPTILELNYLFFKAASRNNAQQNQPTTLPDLQEKTM